MEELESLRDFSKGLEAYAKYLGGSPEGYEQFQQPISSKEVNSKHTNPMEELESLRDFTKEVEAYANYLGGSPEDYYRFLETHTVPMCSNCAVENARKQALGGRMKC